MKLSALTNKTMVVPLPYGDPGDTMTTRPNAVSTSFLIDFASLDETAADAASMREQLRSAVDLLCKVVADWDLLDDDGVPIEVTPEEILTHDIPLRFHLECIRAAVASVGEVSAPEPGKNGASSGAISSKTATSARSQRTTR